MSHNQDPVRAESFNPVIRDCLDVASRVVLQSPDSQPVFLSTLGGTPVGKQVLREDAHTDKNGEYRVETLRLFDEYITQDSGIAIEIQYTTGHVGSNTFKHKTSSIKLDGQLVVSNFEDEEVLCFSSPINPLIELNVVEQYALTPEDADAHAKFIGSHF